VSNIRSVIVPSANLALMYMERLLNGVTQENYARFARPGGVVVHSNHPAFVLGHLALYPQRVMMHFGLPAGATAVPATYEGLFKDGVECRDDVEGKIYPSFEELRTTFFNAYRAAIAAVESGSEEVYAKENPLESSRKLFPTIGSATDFYLTSHVFLHAGQISAWRRAIGMPPAM